jgi:hypothetical protein
MGENFDWQEDRTKYRCPLQRWPIGALWRSTYPNRLQPFVRIPFTLILGVVLCCSGEPLISMAGQQLTEAAFSVAATSFPRRCFFPSRSTLTASLVVMLGETLAFAASRPPLFTFY